MEMKKEGKVTLDCDKETVASISKFRGEGRLDIRHLWDGKPTKKGINIPLDDAIPIITDLIHLINDCTGEEYMLVSMAEFETTDNAEEEVLAQDDIH